MSLESQILLSQVMQYKENSAYTLCLLMKVSCLTSLSIMLQVEQVLFTSPKLQCRLSHSFRILAFPILLILCHVHGESKAFANERVPCNAIKKFIARRVMCWGGVARPFQNRSTASRSHPERDQLRCHRRWSVGAGHRRVPALEGRPQIIVQRLGSYL